MITFRGIAFALAVFPLAMLVIAGNLRPATAGLGTHQQLGLPPCTMRMMFGLRCPSCGMTTSWAHFARGQVYESFAANSGGGLLAIYSLVFAWLSARAGFSGRFPSFRTQKWLAISLLGIVAVTLVDWGIRMWG